MIDHTFNKPNTANLTNDCDQNKFWWLDGKQSASGLIGHDADCNGEVVEKQEEDVVKGLLDQEVATDDAMDESQDDAGPGRLSLSNVGAFAFLLDWRKLKVAAWADTKTRLLGAQDDVSFSNFGCASCHFLSACPALKKNNACSSLQNMEMRNKKKSTG